MAYDQVHGDKATIDSVVLKKASRGFVALMVRQILAYGSVFVGNVFLARMLPPDTYGVFAAAFAFQATLLVFSDIGLGPALIQREQPPTQAELASLFTLQLILYALVAAIIWVLAPWIVDRAHQESVAITVMRVLGVIFLVTSLRSIPAILLERDLRFEVLALTEVAGMVTYHVVVVTLVWAGYGISSLIWGFAARSGIDLFIVLRHQPWRPRFSFNIARILPYIRFGFGFQGVRLMAYMKDQLPIILLVPLAGATSAGMWNWAIQYIGIPVFFIRFVDRMAFTLYSRVQQSPGAMGEIASLSVWLNFAIGLPILFVLLRFADFLVPLIYGSNWLAAMPVVFLLTLNMVGGFVAGTLYPVLFAKGQTYSALRLFSIWVGLTLVGSAIGLAISYLPGMALAYSLSTLAVCIMLLQVTSRLAPFNLWMSLLGPVLALLVSVAATEALIALKIPWIAAVTLTGLIFGMALLMIDFPRIRNLVKSIR